MSDTKELRISPLEEEIMKLEKIRYDIAGQHIKMIMEGTTYAQDVCFKEYCNICEMIESLYKKGEKRTGDEI